MTNKLYLHKLLSLSFITCTRKLSQIHTPMILSHFHVLLIFFLHDTNTRIHFNHICTNAITVEISDTWGTSRKRTLKSSWVTGDHSYASWEFQYNWSLPMYISFTAEFTISRSWYQNIQRLRLCVQHETMWLHAHKCYSPPTSANQGCRQHVTKLYMLSIPSQYVSM